MGYFHSMHKGEVSLKEDSNMRVYYFKIPGFLRSILLKIWG
ncbi:hypothetical protein ASZ90_018636 [hydrocarbon metagenome]|uniref:Uncharacterized protein n=1 Tax=hydrocarbon metagenome TaxID=938273 RepID=A0A0W8E5T4_9ZZZZ